MRTLGLMLIAELTVQMVGYRLEKKGILRVVSKVCELKKSCSTEDIIELLVEGDYVAKGEWMMVVVPGWFSDQEACQALVFELEHAVGTTKVVQLSRDDISTQLMDWCALNYFCSDKIVLHDDQV